MATIAELLKQLGEIKKDSKKAYDSYRILKQAEDALKFELLEKLYDAGLKSAKGKDFTASIVQRSEIIITDEAELREWLENTPEIESDVYIGIKKQEFDTLARSLLKNTGEIPNGTDVKITETLSIRGNS